MFRHLLTAALAAAMASPVSAQEADADWAIARDPAKKLVVAITEYDTGITLGTRCADGGFEAVIAGLPPAGDAAARLLQIGFGDEPLYGSRWTVATDDTIAVSELPAPLARKMRSGGQMRIMIPGGAEGGRNLMYALTLPASSSAIDETLTACGRPLVDPRDTVLDALPDDGLPAQVAWAPRPQPRYPSTRYARGFATLMCLSNPNGTLRDCSIEAEYPRDAGFGESALKSTRRARLRNITNPDDDVPTTMITFRASFFMDGYQTAEDNQAQRDAARRAREERRQARATAE